MPESTVIDTRLTSESIQPGSKSTVHDQELLEKLNEQVKRPDFADVMGQEFTKNDKGDFQVQPPLQTSPIEQPTELITPQKVELEDYNLLAALKQTVEEVFTGNQSSAKTTIGSKIKVAVLERLAKMRNWRQNHPDGSTD